MRGTAALAAVMVAGCGDGTTDRGATASGLRLAGWSYRDDSPGDTPGSFDLTFTYADGLLRTASAIDRPSGRVDLELRYTYDGRFPSALDRYDPDGGELDRLAAYQFAGGRAVAETTGSSARPTTTTYGYDGGGRLATVRVADANRVRTTTLAYDGAGHLSATTDETYEKRLPPPLVRPGVACTYARDASGRLASHTCGFPGNTQRTTTLRYDGAGRVLGTGTATVTYGANGLVETVISEHGSLQTYTYEEGPSEGFTPAIGALTTPPLFGLDGRPLPEVAPFTLEHMLRVTPR